MCRAHRPIPCARARIAKVAKKQKYVILFQTFGGPEETIRMVPAHAFWRTRRILRARRHSSPRVYFFAGQSGINL